MPKLLLILSLLLLSSCISYNEKVVNIQEASGICYMDSNDTFYVVNDEGGLYNINSEGDILLQKELGDYDLEGIYCNNDNKELYLLIENKLELLVVGIDKFKINGKIEIKSLSKKKYFNKKSGAEGITFNKGYFYISLQSEKNNIIRGKLSNNNKVLNIDKEYTINKKDLSGLDFNEGMLHIISDKNDQIYVYDIITETIIETINLNKKHWEGIAYDSANVKYLTDDEGSVIRYNR